MSCWSRRIALVLLLGNFGIANAQTVQPLATRILILFSHSPDGPGVSAFAQALRMTLNERLARPVEYYLEYLDSDRFPEPERQQQLAQYFTNKYRGFHIDVVVAEGSASLEFIQQLPRGGLSNAPVVFALAMDPPPDPATLPPNFTGRLTALRFASTIAMAGGLQPTAEQIVILSGTSPRDSAFTRVAIADLAKQHLKIPIVQHYAASFEDFVGTVRRLPPRSIVLLTLFRRDQSGRYYVPKQVVAALAAASAAPIYGVMGAWMGRGLIAGDMVQLDTEGVKTALLVVRVLQRRAGEPLPAPETASSLRVADWRQLKRWHLSEQRLPPGTQLLFRDPSLWERQHDLILSLSGIFAAQSLLIGLLLIERKRRRDAQVAIQEQAHFERTVADLRTDALRHTLTDSPEALQDALGRIARYAGARRAVLVQYPENRSSPPLRLTWNSAPLDYETADAGACAQPAVGASSGLEIPLVTENARIGTLELYPPPTSLARGEPLVTRLDMTSAIIANAIARSRSARAIRRGEELNRAVLASLPTQIAILDQRGIIIRVNDAWREMATAGQVAPPHDGFVGESYLGECRRAEARGCHEAGVVRAGIEDVLARRDTLFRYEYHLPSSRPRWYEMRVDPLDHDVGGAIVSHLDITERRVAELRAEQARRQVAHLGRVSMVGELAAAVSHELRQPLAAIRANAEAGATLLRRDPVDLGELAMIFRDIGADDMRAACILDDIRLLLRKESPVMAPVDVNEMCRHAIQLLQRDAMLRRVQLELLLEPRLERTLGDPVELQQIIINLVLNALDAGAMSPGIRTVMVNTVRHHGEIEIAVRDSGPGISAEAMKHLFEPFFSTKTQGLGMGLAIVHSIVERHHGRIVAENIPSGGALFRVLLNAVS